MHNTRRFLITALVALAALIWITQLWAPPYAEAAAKHYLVYVGTYTGPQSKGIYAYRFDAGTGKLDPVGLVGELARPSFLAIHPNQRYLYAVSELPNSSVTAFEI